MLRPKKKISRKEIKQDTLVTWYAQVTAFYENNKRVIGIAVTAVVVVVIAGLVYSKNRSDNNERALAQLSQVDALYNQGQYQAAIDGVPERNIPGLKSIVDNFGNSRGENLPGLFSPVPTTRWENTTRRSHNLRISVHLTRCWQHRAMLASPSASKRKRT